VIESPRGISLRGGAALRGGACAQVRARLRSATIWSIGSP
jgi:hypothetical protein